MNHQMTLGRLALALLLCGAAVTPIACSEVVGGNGDGDADDGTDDDGGLPEPQSIDAIDVLLVVDGSGSMADKQGFLAGSFRPFLERLRSPRCVDGSGAEVADQPANVTDPCPAGSVREYAPDVTVHVGVVSSNLGAGMEVCGSQNDRLEDDLGRLVHRGGEQGAANDLPTYQDLGFFAWDPAGRLPGAPGEANFETFASLVESAIRGVGEMGCGFEMPLEAMYRFLADPEPRSLAPDGDAAIDDVILQQRTAFLRPDSVLSVILLSDENDASVPPPYRQLIGRLDARMPLPRAECATDPAGACCVSCIEAVPAGCSGDGGCAEPGVPGNQANFYPSDDPEDQVNLRGWHTKRRFGINLLHPVQRYTDALSSPTLLADDGTSIPNPVFAGGRDPQQVLYTAIVGVPWQDVAIDPSDITSGFQSAAEMQSRGTWDLVLGDPDAYVPATDPRMIESPLPRPGIDLASAGGDPINGGEREGVYDELQYACIFDLPVGDQRDCDEGGPSCDCAFDDGGPNPICDPDQPTLQIRAKAYPGLRQLDLAKRLGDQGRVIPMCGVIPAQGDEPDPGTLGTVGLEVGLGALAEDVASRMSE